METRMGRRSLIAGTGAVALSAALPKAVAHADVGDRCDHSSIPKGSAPRPIPGGVDSGDANVGFIHWWLPGPEDAATQIIGIPGFGLDVDPSTITDFKGVSALAVVAGTVRGGDGEYYDCEFDVRAMKGQYVGEDGHTHHGAFAFL
jgi:hypothetical protein